MNISCHANGLNDQPSAYADGSMCASGDAKSHDAEAAEQRDNGLVRGERHDERHREREERVHRQYGRQIRLMAQCRDIGESPNGRARNVGHSVSCSIGRVDAQPHQQRAA